MKSLELQYKPYKLDFKKPFITSKGSINWRRGFIIKIRNESGQIGVGEAAAPLNFHNTDENDSAFKIMDNELSGMELKLNIDLENIAESVDKNLADFNRLPSLRHGLEQAFLNLICDVKKTTLNHIFNKESKRNVLVNGVITLTTPDKAKLEAEDLLHKGFKTIKIKAGSKDFENDYLCIKEVNDAAGNIPLRIDVNGKWKYKEAVDHLRKLSGFNIEYIEQPVESLEEMAELKKQTSIPLAADESIINLKDAKKFIKLKAGSVLILKPMMLGGLIQTIKIIDLAESKKIKAVVTTSLESCLGKSFAVFAASVISKETWHGLSTSDLFIKDLYPDPYPVKNGTISLENK